MKHNIQILDYYNHQLLVGSDSPECYLGITRGQALAKVRDNSWKIQHISDTYNSDCPERWYITKQYTDNQPRRMK